ncbi:MAG: hypothetical protein PHS80_08565 [Methanothrix sp.]|nr:hypothetical protein [Methanothrix sp.]
MSMLIGMMMTAAGVAILGKVLKESIWPTTNSMKGAHNSSDRVIEIKEYEIVDENQNQPPGGYKVEIRD